VTWLKYYNGCSYQPDGRWLWVRRSLGGIWQPRPVTSCGGTRGFRQPSADIPDLRAAPGGWLAVAVDSPRIAVIGKTKDDALTSFRAERAIWRELMAPGEVSEVPA
jgi:hypothetical protein